MSVAITPELLRQRPLPQPGESKRDRGQIVVLGGSPSTPGAVMLTGLAALRVGAGVLAMAVPEEVAAPVAVAVPEASVTGWRAKKPDWSVLDPVLDRADAIAVGPGIDDPDIAESLVEYVAKYETSAPVLLDAFALGVLERTPGAADAMAGRLVLTPNGNEAERLIAADAPSALDEDAVRHIAARWRAIVSCDNLIASPHSEVVHRAVAGNAGLGTSGSGDVLAGAVAGLMARGTDLESAACWGTYLHCAAGDRLAERIGPLGYLARELLDELAPLLADVDRHTSARPS